MVIHGGEAFGAFLNSKRRERRLTARTMASMAGLDAGYYCGMEHGRRFPLCDEDIFRLADALSLPRGERIAFYKLAFAVRPQIQASVWE